MFSLTGTGVVVIITAILAVIYKLRSIFLTSRINSDTLKEQQINTKLTTDKQVADKATKDYLEALDEYHKINSNTPDDTGNGSTN